MAVNRSLLALALLLSLSASPGQAAQTVQVADFQQELEEKLEQESEERLEGDQTQADHAQGDQGQADPSHADLRRRVGSLLDEIVAASYPELRRSDIRIKFFRSQSDFFRAGFSYCRLFTARRMRFFLLVNPKAFELQAPEAALRAIIAHELSHILYFKERNRLRLFGLVRLLAQGYTIRFERRADLDAISRGYSDGLKQYRRWLYGQIPQRKLAEKQRNYFTPEEVEAAESVLRNRPQMLAYWLKHVPRDLCEILQNDPYCTAKR